MALGALRVRQALGTERRPFGLVAEGAAAFAAAMALLSLAARVLRPDADPLLTMRLDSGIACLLLAASILAIARTPERWPSAPAVLGGAAVSVAGVAAVRYLALDSPGAAEPTGMSSLSILAVSALGIAVMALSRGRGGRVVVGLAFTAGIVGSLGLLTAAFGAAPPALLADVTAMSVPSAAAVISLALAVLCRLPNGGPLQTLAGRSEVARLSRRLLAAAIIVPLAIAFLRLSGERAGWYDTAYGVSLSVVSTVVLLVIVIWRALIVAGGAERESAAARQERDLLFDLSLDLLAVAGPDGRFVRLNPAWETTLGYGRDELVDRPFIAFVHPDDADATAYETRRLFERGETVFNFQNRYRHRDGHYVWLEWTSQPSADRSRVYAVARDITVRKAEEERLIRRSASLAVRNERLAESATRDGLTGLHNRRYLDHAVKRLDLRRRRGDAGGAPMSAVMFDLDHFGAFNKQHGHQAGDVVLRHFGGILRRRFRGGDLVARAGGEEFVAILEGAGLEDAAAAAEQVRYALVASPVTFDGQALHASVSAGCASIGDGMSVAELLGVADVALSMAKRAGRNTVVQA